MTILWWGFIFLGVSLIHIQHILPCSTIIFNWISLNFLGNSTLIWLLSVGMEKGKTHLGSVNSIFFSIKNPLWKQMLKIRLHKSEKENHWSWKEATDWFKADVNTPTCYCKVFHLDSTSCLFLILFLDCNTNHNLEDIQTEHHASSTKQTLGLLLNSGTQLIHFQSQQHTVEFTQLWNWFT